MFEINLLAAAGEAAGGGAHFNWAYVGKHAFNLTVLVGALFYVLKKPVSAFMKSRRADMSARFEESERKLNEAKKLFEECSEKLDNIKSETDSLVSSIAEQAQTERENILRRARREREEILKSVSESVGFEIAKAKVAIRREAVSVSMRIAEQKLKTENGGNAASVKGFVDLLEEGKWLQS